MTPLAMSPGPIAVAREDDNQVAFVDVLVSIHRLLRTERARLRPQMANFGFDREPQAMDLSPAQPAQL